MAAAASTSYQLTDDYSCGYCLQRLPYMVDPKELPCSHVFCLSCLEADLGEKNDISCKICRLLLGLQPLNFFNPEKPELSKLTFFMNMLF